MTVEALLSLPPGPTAVTTTTTGVGCSEVSVGNGPTDPCHRLPSQVMGTGAEPGWVPQVRNTAVASLMDTVTVAAVSAPAHPVLPVE